MRLKSSKAREKSFENSLICDKFAIKKMKDSRTGITFVVLSAKLDNGYLLYVRIPITSIEESVKISNNFLYLMA